MAQLQYNEPCHSAWHKLETRKQKPIAIARPVCFVRAAICNPLYGGSVAIWHPAQCGAA
jgi:hypothetical protein